MRSILRLAALSIVILVATACARQGMPSGGPKDVAPPQVTGTFPDNGSLHFAANEFSVAFDEYITLKEADNNVLVSPPMSPKADIRAKGRSVVVRLRDTLLPNTTYSFQFLNAIADLNEGNLLEHYQYVFSTGESLDSMTIRGIVKDALTMKAPEGEGFVSVLLCDDTLGVRYQTRCNKEGHFVFNHIKDDRYRLVALRDENRNLRLDTTETMAFSDTLVQSVAMPRDSSAVAPLTLLLSTPERERQRVLASEYVAKDRLRIVSKCPMVEPDLACDKPLYWRLNTGRDTLTVWIDAKADSLRLTLCDASGLNDTLRLRYRSLGRPGQPSALARPQPNYASSLPFFDTLAFTLPHPFTLAQTDSILAYLSADSTEQGVASCLPLTPLHSNTDTPKSIDLRILWRPTPGKQYHLRLLSPDTLALSLEATKPEQYGNIILTMEGTGIVELLTEQGVALQRKPATPHLRFDHLKPGNYRLRLIDDRNGDGRWTPGDYYLQRQPENIYYFPKTLTVRENWDMEETWTPAHEQQ